MTDNTILFIIGPVVTGAFTWILARRKYMADAQGKEIDNTEKIIRMWRELSEGMEGRFRSEIDQLRKENNDLKQQIIEVLGENELLRRKLRTLIEHSVEEEMVSGMKRGRPRKESDK